jgi:3-hydroxyisobutyrate dehydrogenase-like beta-hydroxyacid dehydrogenase
MERVAFLGTGLLGAGMVERALGTGLAVTVWNRTAAKARALEPRGAVVAATPEQAVAGALRVHLVLQDDAAVDDVLERVIPALAPDAIVIDHSTTSPAGTKARTARARERGVRFVHAPVFMSPQMAREGTAGLMMISAAAEDYAAVRGALERMTGEAWYVGERADLAAAYKLFGNAMLFAISAGLADILAMAVANDIDPPDALQVFSKWSFAAPVLARGQRMARGDFSPSFALSMARKDLRLMLETAAGEPLVALPSIATRMDEAIAAGHGDDDLAAVAAPVIARVRKSTR